MAKCIRVPKREGESARSRLMADGMLNLRARIGSDGDHLLIPILCDEYDGYEVVDAELREQEQKVTDYRDLVDVPPELKELLPTSFDVVGDVAMMKIPDELKQYRGDIGKALLKVNRTLRIVFEDHGVKGDFRIRDLEHMAGEGPSETTHKEFGVVLTTDPARVYFNPRLSSERFRIASQVQDGDVVIDMFAGVAPFGTVICKLASPEVVYSIDLNPEAEHFARYNAERNHIDRIVAMTGDSSVLIYDLPMADRIVMNLPQIADRFLGFAMDRLKVGGTAYMYKILERADLERFCDDLVWRMAELGFGIVINVSELKTYSPTMSVYSMDVVRTS